MPMPRPRIPILIVAVFPSISPRYTKAARERIKTMTAKDAKYGFGRLIDLARTMPVVVEHSRPAVVVIEIEEFEPLKAFDMPLPASTPAANQGSKN